MICAHCDAECVVCETCPECGAAPWLTSETGRYALESLVGRGAFGVTWRGRDEAGQRFAIKELPLRHAPDSKHRDLFHREAEVLRQLDHPGIPSYHEHFIAGTGRARALYLVEEYVDGTTLDHEMATRRYRPHEVLAIVAELATVLDYLHTLSPPVIHRDLKPRNVMRRDDGRLVLVDFGSVRDALVDPVLGGSTVTGTFGFMAPEQFRGDATPRTDLYGLGALAVALLTRTEPHELMDDGGRLAWEDHVAVPGAVAQLLRDLLQPDPAQRPDSAKTVATRALALHIRRPTVGYAASPPGPLPPVALTDRKPALPTLLTRVRDMRGAPHQHPRPSADVRPLNPVQTTAIAMFSLAFLSSPVLLLGLVAGVMEFSALPASAAASSLARPVSKAPVVPVTPTDMRRLVDEVEAHPEVQRCFRDDNPHQDGHAYMEATFGAHGNVWLHSPRSWVAACITAHATDLPIRDTVRGDKQTVPVVVSRKTWTY